MPDDIYAALDRTALLLERDVFGPDTDHQAIIDGLRATTARIIADRANLASPAGQTAAVTLCAQLAMQGLQIDLDLPAVPLLQPQPPLGGGELQAGLLDYAASLLPGGSARPAATPDVTFAIGDAPAPHEAIRVSGTAWTAAAGATEDSPRWRGTAPTGAMAASAAAAADGLRAALPRIAARLGRPAPGSTAWRLMPGRITRLDLSDYQIRGPAGLGKVDVISGGAITSACLYALLRLPQVTADLRIIEPDRLEISNLNRYALATRPMCGWQKTRALAVFQTASIRITGLDTILDEDTMPLLAPFAPRMLVGTDDIPSRWTAQQAAPGWVGVGASSHDFVLVSAHPAGSACVGCVHLRDENIAGTIPTVSFVSFWAGLIQALELVAAARGLAPGWTRTTNLWPLGLDNPRGIQHLRQKALAACPAGCAASAGPGRRSSSPRQ